ncbi:MAG TPA: CDP-archaeol synthase [Patescibacteria group bacterium]|nr:CDP-archaeol synthase [Patescibacteria group bacterium]
MNTLLFILWYFLPAGLANTAPIFAAKISWLKRFTYPLDFYKKLNEKRIFGDHKTIRGIVAGIVVGIFIASLQSLLFSQASMLKTFIPNSFAQINPIWFGFLSAMGALGGDAIKSFFKRQMSIASGKSWFPYDQIDYIVGGVLLTAIIYPLSFGQYVLLFVIWFLLHPISTIVGYILKLKDSPI